MSAIICLPIENSGLGALLHRRDYLHRFGIGYQLFNLKECEILHESEKTRKDDVRCPFPLPDAINDERDQQAELEVNSKIPSDANALKDL